MEIPLGADVKKFKDSVYRYILIRDESNWFSLALILTLFGTSSTCHVKGEYEI